MAEIIVTRQDSPELTEEQRQLVRTTLFGFIDGLGERNRRAWRRLWNGLLKLQPGETVELQTHRARLGWYHRKHMAMEAAVFEAQERFDNFKAFRSWLKMGAGHVDWFPGPKGGIVPIPRSIAYAEIEQGEFERFHDDCITFLRTEHAAKTLWPKMPAADRANAIELVLARFEEH
ncbi:Protein of unknown function DUF1367 [uncultured Caudovirales phage]|uniref:Uncharacterized protein n=1 Tax=uncultured Caudovirales phage TaxID=2100421 RepID=A0A6J5NQF5_9CAUD|nr:Protein of unknown function DUF1367 [uncultured Caudovirales phage]